MRAGFRSTGRTSKLFARNLSSFSRDEGSSFSSNSLTCQGGIAGPVTAVSKVMKKDLRAALSPAPASPHTPSRNWDRHNPRSQTKPLQPREERR